MQMRVITLQMGRMFAARLLIVQLVHEALLNVILVLVVVVVLDLVR